MESNYTVKGLTKITELLQITLEIISFTKKIIKSLQIMLEEVSFTKDDSYYKSC